MSKYKGQVESSVMGGEEVGCTEQVVKQRTSVELYSPNQ